MGRPKCACFEGTYPTTGDYATEALGHNMMQVFVQLMGVHRICPDAGEYAIAAAFCGMAGMAYASALEEGKNPTPDEISAAVVIMAERLPELVRQRLRMGEQIDTTGMTKQ